MFEISNYIKNQLLKDSDWASMSNAVELRVPLLDKKLSILLYLTRISQN